MKYAGTLIFGMSLGLASLTHAADEKPTRLPEIKVIEEIIGEETAVGPYQQPEWTTHRRFSNTRVYLQKQPWEVGMEQWWRGTFNRDGTSKHRIQEEVEIGLPHRFQLDLYENLAIDTDGRFHQDNVAVELRYALADWGKIPLNPTLYGEYKLAQEGSDIFELKLLLGDQLAPRWHWGVNLVWEQETRGERETDLQVAGGISYTVMDQKLSIGAEVKFENATVRGARGDASNELLIGPSIQWRIKPRMHLDISPLFGVNEDAPTAQIFIIFGIDLWSPNSKDPGYSPISTKSQ